MATATTRKSRAQRSAEQAEQDATKAAESGDIEPTAEAVEQAAAEQAKPEPKPDLPLATGDLGQGRIVYYQPSVTLPDGTVIDCPHSTWGHGSEKAATACLRKVAAEHGVRLEAPQS
jgi:hypothetical protein